MSFDRLIILACCFLGAATIATAESKEGGVQRPTGIELERFGNIRLYWPPSDAPNPDIVIFFGDRSEPEITQKTIERLNLAGALVAAMDWTQYLGTQNTEPDSCVQFWDLERIGQVIQSRLKLSEIQLPKLGGVGQGAFGAMAAMLTYPERFRGVLVVNSPEFITSNNPACESSSPVHLDLATKKLTVEKSEQQSDELLVLSAEEILDSQHNSARLTKWLDVEKEPSKSFDSSEQYLGFSSEPSTSGKPLIVFLSGDGGWAAIDKQVTVRFVEKGFGVLGINSLRYLWHRREPLEIGKFITSVVSANASSWRYTGIILAGFSLGAEVLPATLRFAPAQLKREVKAVVMLSPSEAAEFEVHLTDWIGLSDQTKGRPLAPDLASLKLPMLCISGQEDDDSGCPQSFLPNSPPTEIVSKQDNEMLETIVLPGGHHFDEQYGKIADRIIEWWQRKSASQPAG